MKTATPNRADAGPTARPRDVALLVEQVFEDLRQRRLTEARERTESLKRLVAHGAAAIPAASVAVEAPTDPASAEIQEPGIASQESEIKNSVPESPQLDADADAGKTAADDADRESFFDEDEPLSE